MISFINREFSAIEKELENKKIKSFVKSSCYTSYQFPALVDINKLISLLPENPDEEACSRALRLSFFSFMGTDGMRGKVSCEKFTYLDAMKKLLSENLITPALIELSTKAYIMMMKQSGRPLKACIGNDSRDKATGWTLTNTLKNAFLESGVELTDLQVVPTPYVPEYMLKNDIAFGAVLTASHNPSNQNGIKYFIDGKKLLSDGKNGDFILSAYMYELAVKQAAAEADEEKEIHAAEKASCLTIDYVKEAAEFLDSIVSTENIAQLKNCKIIADMANGAWSLTAAEFFSKKNLQLELLNFKPEGENINHNCGVAEIEGHFSFTKDELISAPKVIQRVYEEGKVSSVNVYGIAVDGDGDRGFVMKYDKESDSVVVFDGDSEAYLIESLIGQQGKRKQNAVFTIESDLMVGLEMQEKFGLNPVMVDVGDKWICNQESESVEIGFESSGHVIIPCVENNKILLTGNGLLTALMTIISLEKGNTPFEKGYSNTLYTYFVKKELFYNGSTLWKEDIKLIESKIKELDGFELEPVEMKDPNVLVFYINYEGKKCAILFSRNSGTEDKNAVYLKCRNGFEQKLLPLAKEICRCHREKMLDASREEVICENKILQVIKEKGFAVKDDLNSFSNIAESAFHALVKERIISNRNDSYYGV